MPVNTQLKLRVCILNLSVFSTCIPSEMSVKLYQGIIVTKNVETKRHRIPETSEWDTKEDGYCTGF